MVRPQRNPQELRTLARGCRELAQTARDPADIEQFGLWATELADAADEVERRSRTTKGSRHPLNGRERRRA
jgi:hypothetical protein